MKDFEAWSSFLSAPFTSHLILEALRKSFPKLRVQTDRNVPWEVAQYHGHPVPFLQWSTYDSLSHELTLDNPTTVTPIQSMLPEIDELS
jgi:hypothetical protein